MISIQPNSGLSPPLPAADTGQQVDLTVRADGLEPAILINLTVDRDGNPFVELPPHFGEAFAEHAQEPPDVGRLNVEFFGPTSELLQVAR